MIYKEYKNYKDIPDLIANGGLPDDSIDNLMKSKRVFDTVANTLSTELAREKDAEKYSIKSDMEVSNDGQTIRHILTLEYSNFK